ncbi:alanine dehydrogenase [Pasteurella skyensis]|uniref:Alanine dehydrogenase n=1 Tax=Phocoenobacter skyensis TaxID=97481 RepID=A0AAJ6NBN7_9PAST|nr:alanine dehydrogenase [Pasteurella skyensis]MDP8163504.1 alanine dehydrogenase [Pasteurella skyensis]MDP8173816.1 alanine dehydrogenase [Pasteurella skyensis]MDP8177889.1 alanine dehydrogenase [Pasteurella skyensis]MDP8179968.1 alanine dehydrogenase [Pasteurella skyensis]MDP8184068.1 alanine dehydrogenase [Pasteurella skyensis]
MIIGCPKEVKVQEYRVGLTPDNVRSYVEAGHTVYIEHNAGAEIGFPDQDYADAGATLTDKATLFKNSEMIIKVKEPIECEYDYFREGQILYTYLHLAADKPLMDMLLAKNIQAIAYETIKTPTGLPCLAPMSMIAGRLATLESAKYIQKTFGGAGVLLSGTAGTPKAKVVILGGGVVGLNAAQIAMGIGADVTILDINAARLAYIDQIFDMKIKTLTSSRGNILNCLKEADVVIGAVLIPGAKAPHLVRREDLKLMKKGAILTDVAIDQGGCFETSHPTTHNEPIYEIDGIIHYCVANMPGCVARTSTLGLTDSTLEYGLTIARLGVKEACLSDSALLEGLNTYNGKCTFKGVSDAFGIAYTSPEIALQ